MTPFFIFTALVGGVLGWLIARTLAHGRRLRELEARVEEWSEIMARHQFASALAAFTNAVERSGRCPECQVQVSDRGLVHTEDCKARKLFEQGKELFGKRDDPGEEKR